MEYLNSGIDRASSFPFSYDQRKAVRAAACQTRQPRPAHRPRQPPRAARAVRSAKKARRAVRGFYRPGRLQER